MEYLKNSWKTVVGNNQEQVQPSVIETIEKLIGRVETSTLLEDRRDACRALKSLSKTYRLEVGARGLDVLINVLNTDRNDPEAVSYTLDALNNIISGHSEDSLDYNGSVSPNEETEGHGIQFTEMFAKRNENITLILDLMDEYEFKIRWPALKLLMGLLRNKLKHIQDAILASPMGVSKLVDLLADGRDIIRNDAILLLVHLTRGNANIQKIVAFENAFDKLLEIIATEGYSDGGVIVEDSLIVLLNLLINNTSNQNFFKEGSYIQRLIPFLEVAATTDWSGLRTNNFLVLLRIIRALVSPSNPQQVTSSCQKVMHSSGVLKKLCDILLTVGVPSDILTEAINTVAEIIRGNHHNQDYLSSLEAPVDPPKPLLILLLMSMVNEKQSFDLRCSVLYCFECFLFQNEFIQAQVVQTLLPNAPETSSITMGQLLCGGLFSNDPLSNWFVSTALSHTLVGNKIQKEQLLRVQLATEDDGPPIPLLKQCCTLLQSCSKNQTRIGLLMFLANWLSNCPMVVSHFLQIPTNVPYLTAQVGLTEGEDTEILIQGLSAFLLGICIHDNNDSVQSFKRDDLLELILKRVGLDIFLDKLSSVSKSDKFSLASQKPQIKSLKADQLIFDYEFCKLFRSLEASIIKVVQNNPTDLINGPESNMSAEQHRLLIQYKELIREQDQQISTLRSELTGLKDFHSKTLDELKELSATCQQLRDQNSLLKAHKSATTISSLSTLPSSGVDGFSEDPTKQMLYPHSFVPETKIKIMDDSDEELDNLKREKLNLLERIQNLEMELSRVAIEKTEALVDTENYKKELQHLQMVLANQEYKIQDYMEKLKGFGYSVEEAIPPSEILPESNQQQQFYEQQPFQHINIIQKQMREEREHQQDQHLQLIQQALHHQRQQYNQDMILYTHHQPQHQPPEQLSNQLNLHEPQQLLQQLQIQPQPQPQPSIIPSSVHPSSPTYPPSLQSDTQSL